VKVIGPAFEEDPVYSYFLNKWTLAQRKEIIPKMLYHLVKACALNDAKFIEAGNWGSCVCLVPPGKKMENPFTILQAGLIPMLAATGFPAGMVRSAKHYKSPNLSTLQVVNSCSG
jgi:hypothetical protein